MSELAVSPLACVPPAVTLISNVNVSGSDRHINEEVTKLESQLAELFRGVVERPRRGKMDDMI
jgi:hypothetical protein